MMREWLRRLTRRGYAGPSYQGLLGKLRFAWEESVWHEEIVWYATPGTWSAVAAPSLAGLELHAIQGPEAMDDVRGVFEREYYAGCLDEWARYFSWGERVVLARRSGQPVGFNWYQLGTQEGFQTFYGALFEDDGRVCRGGVFPSMRQQGINTKMKWLLLKRLFDGGVRRVYADCSRGNVASVRALAHAGFRPFGMLGTASIGGRVYVRWKPVTPVLEELRLQGVLPPGRE